MPASLASAALSESEALDNPETVAPVKFTLPLAKRLVVVALRDTELMTLLEVAKKLVVVID